MKSSRGEIKICEILDAAGLDYQEEYTFPDLVSSSGRPLRFDFAVFDDNGDLDFLIEFQGIQHYEPVEIFGGEEQFKIQQEHDKRKCEYAKTHNITLIEIPYWDFENIETILESRLLKQSA